MTDRLPSNLPRAAPESPLLTVGLSGFSPAERSLVTQFIAGARAGTVAWSQAGLADADVWFISGSRARQQADGTVRVPAGLPSERSLRFQLDQQERPVAFSLPLGSMDFRPTFTFELTQASIDKTLYLFEGWLQPLRAQFALGAQLISRPAAQRQGAYHLFHDEELVATLDFDRLSAGLAPRAMPGAISGAAWEPRKPTEGVVPAGFVPCSMVDLHWTYVRRTGRMMLPNRYRRQRIFFRQTPHVPVAWLRDSHLAVLQELLAEPADFQALSQKTGIPGERLDRDLACLYYAGAITTTPLKSNQPGPAAGTGHTMSSFDPLGQDHSELPLDAAHDATVPAALCPTPVMAIAPDTFMRSQRGG